MCPASLPTNGDPCTDEGQVCDYGTCCVEIATCKSGHWDVPIVDCPMPVCPPDPPVAGTSCACEPSQCDYDLCSANGSQITATCSGTTWNVASMTCMPTVTCDGVTCNPGEICLHISGGVAKPGMCTADPCQGQSLDCSCADTLCPSMIYKCSTQGQTDVSCVCSTCP